jgi:hypothetical protein
VMPASHGPLDRGRGQALLAHELVHINQQRSLGSSLPTEDSSAGQALEREAQSAESLVGQAGRSAFSTPSMPLARRQNSSADRSSSAGTQSQAVSEATSVALAAGEARTPGGESGSIDVPSLGAAVRTTHAAQRSAASTGPAPSSAGESESSADGDFDELARRIYERVRLRLRRELLVDRERGGHLTDSR